ncbi:hypothetical protein LKK83_17090, partial [Phormidium sp. CCY1219]|nr:hypothetical protein [Phormidium sp. CCY1219]
GKASIDKLRKYYHHGANGNWTFQAQEGLRLFKHDETPIKRHIKVKDDKSPFDGDWAYWSKRGINKVGIPAKLAKLLKKQKGKCNECGLFFTDSDLLRYNLGLRLELYNAIANPMNPCHAPARKAKARFQSSAVYRGSHSGAVKNFSPIRCIGGWDRRELPTTLI